MLSSEIKDIRERYFAEIEYIQEHPSEDHYIDAHFQMFLNHGEHDDNSLDLGIHYHMMLELAKDNTFLRKIEFFLKRFVPSREVVYREKAEIEDLFE